MMTIEYQSKRAEVAAAYFYTWRHSWRMRLFQTWIAVTAFAAWSIQLSSPERPFRSTILPAALGTLAVLAFLPLYPQIMFKSRMRRLTVDPDGIHTTIGSLRGDIPWARVASVSLVGDRIYVLGKNLNSFVIPDRAFSGVEHRAEFVKNAESWWKGAPSQPTA
jgi:hypothetical protein